MILFGQMKKSQLKMRHELFAETCIDYAYADVIRLSSEFDDKMPLVKRMSLLNEFRGLVDSNLDMDFLRSEKNEIDKIKIEGERQLTQDQKIHMVLWLRGKMSIDEMTEQQKEFLLKNDQTFRKLYDYVNTIGKVGQYFESLSDIRATLRPIVVGLGQQRMDEADLEAYRLEQELENIDG